MQCTATANIWQPLPPSRLLPRDQSGSFPKTNGPSRPIYNAGKTRARSEPPAIVARVNSESALKGASKGIGAFECHRCAYVFDTVVPNGKAATDLVKPQPLNEISWSGAKFYLEPPTKVSGTETHFGGKSLPDKFSFRWLNIQVVNSDKRETDCVWNCNGSEYCS